jgi:osmotically-inducible protein OsmY
MSRISIGTSESSVRKILNTFANIGVVSLLILTVGTGYAATPPLRPETQRQADRVITEQVYDALAADPIYYFRHVDVYVRDGVVTLSGYVWERQDIYRARELTARVPEVVGVLDQMELEIW